MAIALSQKLSCLIPGVQSRTLGIDKSHHGTLTQAYDHLSHGNEFFAECLRSPSHPILRIGSRAKIRAISGIRAEIELPITPVAMARIIASLIDGEFEM